MTSNDLKSYRALLILICSLLSLTLVAQPTGTCDTPTGFEITDLQSTLIDVAWDNMPEAISYTIELREVGVSAWSVISGITNNATNFGGLEPGVEYEIRIASFCVDGLTEFTESLFFTTLNDCIDRVPEFNGVFDITETSATVHWIPIDDAISYILEYRVSDIGEWVTFNDLVGDSYTLTGLEGGTTYQIRVAAICPEGQAAFSGMLSITTPGDCPIPQGFAITNVYARSVDLVWEESSEATSYQYLYKQPHDFGWSLREATENPMTVVLNAGTEYQFKMRSVCDEVFSLDTEILSVTTLTTVPCGTEPRVYTHLTSENSAILIWNPMTNVSTYRYRYVPTSGGATVSGSTSANEVTLTDLVPDTEYEFTFRPVCADGTSSTFTTHLFTTINSTTCSDANGLLTTNITSSSATLNWVFESGALSYDVRYKATDEVNWTEINTTTWTINIEELLPDTDYEYQVRINCTFASSDFSESTFFRTLEFSEPTCNIPADINSTVTSIAATLSWEQVTEALNYDYRYRPATAPTWIVGNTTESNVELTTLLADTVYEYQIQTVCDGQVSGYSDLNTFSTATLTICDLPILLGAEAINDSTASFGWEVVAGASSYDYRIRVEGTTEWTSGNIIGTFLVNSGLKAGTTYEFQVQSVCDGEVSGYTAIVTVTTTGGITIEDCAVAPQNLTSSNVTGSGATVSWTAVDAGQLNFHQYRYRPTSGGGWTTATTTSNSVDLSGLSAGTEYEFIVRNNCVVGGNSPTSSVTFTTGAGTSASADRGASLQYYPNPVRKTLNVTSDNTGAKIVRIYNLNGALVKEVQVTQGDVAIDVQNFEKGLYIMEMVTQRKVEVKRFNKE